MRDPRPWTPEEDEILLRALACRGMLLFFFFLKKKNLLLPPPPPPIPHPTSDTSQKEIYIYIYFIYIKA